MPRTEYVLTQTRTYVSMLIKHYFVLITVNKFLNDLGVP
jgi:hypothetical protein